MRRSVLAILAVALLVAAGCSGSAGSSPAGSVGPTPSPTPKQGTITGNMTLIDSGNDRSGTICSGTGGYSDFGPGMNVVVKNEKGEIIGTSVTEPGPVPSEFAVVTCTVSFSVEELPRAKFYEIEVGRRGALTYSYEELEGMDWHLELSLGS